MNMVSVRNVRVGVGILLAVLLALAALQQGQLIARMGFDGENSPGEGVSMFALSRLRAGGTLYLDYRHPPHACTPYMPLFYWATELVARAGKSWQEMVTVARCTAYGYWVGVGIAIFGLARRAKCAWPAALLAASSWGAGELAPGWANSVRPDAAALFFSLAALWVYQRRQTRINLAGSTGLLIVAALHKQTAVAPLAAIVLAEFLAKRYLRAATVAGAWGGAMAAVVIAGQALTGGRFVLNTITSIALPWPWLMTWALVGSSLAMGAVAFWGGALACVAKPRQPRVALLKHYFVISLALSFVRSRVFGAWSNHYLEPFAVGCVLTGMLAQDILTGEAHEVVRWSRVWWLATALGVSIVSMVDKTREVFQQIGCVDETSWKRLVADLSELDGPVLSEDDYLSVRSGRTAFILEVDVFAHFQNAGKFDDTELLRKIERREFAAVITKVPIDAAMRPRWAFSRRWLEPIRAGYELARTYGAPEHTETRYLYRPRTVSINGAAFEKAAPGETIQP